MRLPVAWSGLFGGGFGAPAMTVLNLNTYLSTGIQLFVYFLRLPWNAVYRLLFFWPFLVVGICGSWYLYFGLTKNKMQAALGVLVYMSNTYVLMLAGGGQVGLLMAYAVSPFVMAGFIRRKAPLFTVSAGLLLLFDLRFSLLVAAIMAGYCVSILPPRQWIRAFLFCLLPGVVIAGLHSFWLIPAIFSHGLSLPNGYGSTDWLTYLSWAEFSKSISLLHPNWPENIFGKTYFLQPEYLVVPIAAFGSLVFTTKNKMDAVQKKYVYFFILLALAGAFLAKGAKPPFAAINQWIFGHVPLFNGFRDPTKFYLLIIVAYAYLVPFSLMQLSERLRTRFHFNGKKGEWVVFVGVIVFWLVLIRQFAVGTLTGTFEKLRVPRVYDAYASLVHSRKEFGRTLVVPWRNRYMFQSENHPAIDARDVFKTTDVSGITKALTYDTLQNLLKDWDVQYVVVPDDVTHEVFLKDRIYDPSQKIAMVKVLDALPFLEKKKGFDSLSVYEVTQPTGHFYALTSDNTYRVYTAHQESPVLYKLDISATYRPVDVIFSENFDPAWKMWDGKKVITAQKSNQGLMHFPVDSDYTGQVMVFYENQRWVTIGYGVSFTVILLIGGFLCVGLLKRTHMWKPQWVGVVLLFCAGAYIAYTFGPVRNLVASPSIWKSKEWTMLANPVTNTPFLVSRYGGGEMRFRVSKTKSVSVVASSSNNDAGIQGIDVIIQGKSYSFTTPLHDSKLVASISGYDPNKTYDVVIRNWCASLYAPCDIGISDIHLDRGGGMSRPTSVPAKSLAVLGDSISVSFGNLNYSYLLSQRLGVTLHNAAIFGSSVVESPGLDWSGKRYEQDIIRFKPDILMIVLGTNDLLHDKTTFRSLYTKMVQDIQKGSPDTKIIAVGLFMRTDFSRRDVESMSEIIKNIATQQHIQYIDPYEWLAAQDLQDVVHPAVKSEKKISDAFYPYIGALVAK
jgi:lysophospholipase L1-like esterase